MAGRVASIYAEIGLKTDKLDAGLKQVKTGLNKFGSDLKGGLSKVNAMGAGLNNAVTQLTGFNLAQLGAAGAVAMVAKGIGDSIKFTQQYTEQIRTLSAATGMNNQETSKMIQLFDDAGVSTEQITAASRKMIQQGLNPSIDTIAKLADEYNALNDPVAKGKILLDNFGRAGLEMGKLLDMGSDAIRRSGEEAEKAGLVMSDEAMKAAEDYRQSIDKLADSFEGVKVKVGMALIPALDDAVDGMGRAIDAAQLLVTWNKQIADAYADHTKEVLSLGLSYDDYIAEMLRSAVVVDKLSPKQAALIKLLIENGTITNANTEYLYGLAKSIGIVTEAEYQAAIMEARVTDERKEAINWINMQKGAADALIPTVEELALAEAAAALAAEKEAGIYEAVTGALRNSNVPLGEKVDLLKELALLSGATTKEQVALDDAVKFLTRSLELGYISEDQYLRITNDLAEGALNGEKGVRAIEKAIIANTTAAGNATEPINALTGNMGTLDQSMAEAAKEAEWLKTSIDNLKNKTITVTVKYNAVGGIITTNDKGERDRAVGGPVSAGGMYVVGEKGPELFVPNSSGQIIPNNKLSGGNGMSGGQSFGDINIFIEGGDAEETAIAVMSRFTEATRAANYAGISYAG